MDELLQGMALRPEIVVIDLFARPFLGLRPSDLPGRPRIVVVSSNNTAENVASAISHNVPCYLTKMCDEQEIRQAFISVARGEKFFCNQILEIVLRQHPASATIEENCKPSKLSAREVEIIRLVASGLTTNAIALQLHLSPHTVYTHRKNIMRKVNVKSAPELVLYAVNEGLIATGSG